MFLDASKSYQNLPEKELVIFCYCASWCSTCLEYKKIIENFSKERLDILFFWIDIESYPEYLGEEEIENFPTILIQYKNRSVFFGPVVPNLYFLKKIIKSLNESSMTVKNLLPDFMENLFNKN